VISPAVMAFALDFRPRSRISARLRSGLSMPRTSAARTSFSLKLFWAAKRKLYTSGCAGSMRPVPTTGPARAGSVEPAATWGLAS